MLQGVHILQKFDFFLLINVHPQIQSPLYPKNAHFPILIHADIHQGILQAVVDIIVHAFLHAAAFDPAFIRDALFQPVCLPILRQIHAEHQEFPFQLHLILTQADLQLPAADVRQKQLPDAFLCSRKRNFFLDPVGVLFGGMKLQEVYIFHFFVNRNRAVDIHCGFFVLQLFPANLHLYHCTDTQFSGMYQRYREFHADILYKIAFHFSAIRIHHLFKWNLAF